MTGPQARDSAPDVHERLWIERLKLTEFRNYQTLTLELDQRPVVLTGPNGAGKTNLLEAITLLAPGRGLRRSVYGDLSRQGGAVNAGLSPRGGWAVAARLHGLSGEAEVGTGFTGEAEASGRSVRIDGTNARGSGALGEHMRVLWLIPAMDGLFTGAAGERRAFLDRLIQSLSPGFRDTLSRFERAMRQRNRLFEAGVASPTEFEGLEMQMAETGVAIAAARRETVARLHCSPDAQEDDAPFPWATLALDGALEAMLEREAAVDVEDTYREMLARGRPRDAAAKRSLDGPHRSDLLVGHGPKGMAARNCSTGEQKALLTGLVLSHARLVREQSGGLAPVLLLDEIAAHLDELRRAALFDDILKLGAQAWMSGTDVELFSALEGKARFIRLENGGVSG